MFASIARLALLAIIALGAWKFYPRLKPAIQPILANPKTLGAEIIDPAIRTINKILPDKIQIPVPTNSDRPPEAKDGAVDGASTSSPNSSNNPNLTNIVDQVKQKAGEIAQDQIDAAKKEAGKAFCQVLIEKVKTECGNIDK